MVTDSRELEGMIVKGVGGSYTVLANGVAYECTPRGIFRNNNVTPLIGDYCTITATSDTAGILHTLAPRKNQLIRPPIANIDQAIITVSTAKPAFNPGLLDRFLALVALEDIPAIICVNKSDLSHKPALLAGYQMAGYQIIYTSTTTHNGLDDLRQAMAGKTNVFAGPSGVGKSSIINALHPQLALETGELSQKLGRGKHTTRHSQIFALDGADGGYCIDTPGFTSLDTATITKQELGDLFIEFREYKGDCKFGNCLHAKEKDCGIKAQLGVNIHQDRYDSYIKLLENM